ncbi:glycosyltransferase [Parasedimentitalea maritima]|uniref:Glycosyltransferase n=2 Tax=Parasedimentitalea maritima TaxID=2578117 RepID=A0ABY2US86_9RHOB|nr:glycosyltransferase [Zongyanglinia marina]
MEQPRSTSHPLGDCLRLCRTHRLEWKESRQQGVMDTITILMGVYKGGDFLPEQLASMLGQTHSAWHLIASDDSPVDDSRHLLKRFSREHSGRMSLVRGPGVGFSANYLSLLRAAPSGYVALADQDDVWHPDKLARAHAALATLPAGRPALYCARVQPWDGAVPLGAPARALARPLGFANALIENVAVGNTIVLNPPAVDLARQAAQHTTQVFAHDWWLYQLITGTGGIVYHDDGPPVLLYRQHGGNAIGAGRGIVAQLRRKSGVLRGAFAQRLSLNADALEQSRALLTPENRTLFDAFETARAQSGTARLWQLARLGVYRQRPLKTAGFFGAAALGRI